MTNNEKNSIKKQAFNFLYSFGENIKAKFDNVCAKTGQYDVPSELFQKRTSRKNRILISWKTVKANKLTIQQLETFYGGVVVELVNEDYFTESNWTNPVFCELVKKIGSNENVSTMISIRSECGSSSSQLQRECFDRLIDNTPVLYNGIEVIVNKNNYKDYAIKREYPKSIGNENWSGFLFISIKGGQQDTIETHRGCEELLFNPACEYANESVCIDINLVVSYFALASINADNLSDDNKKRYIKIKKDIEVALQSSYYNNPTYRGNLLDYVKNHPSIKIMPGFLCDPIQIKQINIRDFDIKNKEDERNLDFTHNEAVNFNKFYWDDTKNCILSPARPTNIFWSKHLSNMMQQNFSLDEYFRLEEERVRRRKEIFIS